MIVKFLSLLLILVSLIYLPELTLARVPKPQILPPLEVAKNPQIEAKRLDDRAKALSDYLALHNSPLQYHAQDFIDASDAYSIDWKLVPAIAGVESTFGKFIPGGYNAWGWGVYGNQALGFKSWRDGIFTVTSGLKLNYINKGLTNPHSMNRIYAASPFWGGKVSYFMKELDSFTKNHQLSQFIPLEQQIKVAAQSGQLAI